MLLNIKRIPEGRSVFSQSFTAEGEHAQWISYAGQIACKAEIDCIPTQIAVHIYYKAPVTLECSRCLKVFDYPIENDFYLNIKKRSQVDKNNPDVETIDFLYNDTTEELDISSAIFDDIILMLPMKPLCSENCVGFSLYNNNSEKDSSCINNNDPRWDALKKMKNSK